MKICPINSWLKFSQISQTFNRTKQKYNWFNTILEKYNVSHFLYLKEQVRNTLFHKLVINFVPQYYHKYQNFLVPFKLHSALNIARAHPRDFARRSKVNTLVSLEIQSLCRKISSKHWRNEPFASTSSNSKSLVGIKSRYFRNIIFMFYGRHSFVKSNAAYLMR